jgi:ABC-2 type transport system ATP-binding protein
MRDLLKGYADRGGTVLLSSHLLNEVELIADEMILIGRGRIVAQGTKKSLLAGAAGAAATYAAGTDLPALARHLGEAGLETTPMGEGLQVSGAPVDVGTVAAKHALVLTELREVHGGLEDLFLQLTEDDQRDVLAPDGLAAAPTTTSGGQA